MATKFFVVPYTWVGTDDYGIPHAFVVEDARDAGEAFELVCQRVQEDNKSEWGYAAAWGDSSEHGGGGCYYMCGSCDCGDDDCAPDEDGDGGHETVTVCVNVHEQDIRGFATLEEARTDAERIAHQTPEVLIVECYDAAE